MPLMHDQIDDFVELTLNNFKKKSWVDLSLDLQHYQFAGRMATMKKLPTRGGPQLEWKVQVSNTGTARASGLFDTDQTNVKNLMTSGSVPWTMQTVNFSYDINESIFQTGPETIIEELQIREHSMYNDYFELMEQFMWTAPSGPVSSSADIRVPFGIPYWVVQSTTEGFNGGNPSGFTSGAGGINSNTYANWSNWTAGYDAWSRGDGIKKLLKAMDYTEFHAPHAYNELSGGAPDWCMYTVYENIEQTRIELQAANDNLGNDIGKYSGDCLVRGVPLKWVPALDNSSSAGYDANKPVYGLNWKVFRWYFAAGRDMIRQKPKDAANQRNVRVVHMDSWGNFQCDNRRKQFVLRSN